MDTPAPIPPPITGTLGENISDREYQLIRSYIFDALGIDLTDHKQVLVTARLGKRLRHHKLDSYRAYYDLVTSGAHPAERQIMLDLLTTNETYFFREPTHFDTLRDYVGNTKVTGKLKVWSAASSSGEEAYSLAMLLEDALGSNRWEILGSDISTRVLSAARTGHYSLQRTDGIPRDYLKKYCLCGTGPHEGTLLIDRSLRQQVRFIQVNLNSGLPPLGPFDVIFLRNVLIYFNPKTKAEVIKRMVSVLKPGGLLFVGHSESLKEIDAGLETLGSSTYKKK